MGGDAGSMGSGRGDRILRAQLHLDVLGVGCGSR